MMGLSGQRRKLLLVALLLGIILLNVISVRTGEMTAVPAKATPSPQQYLPLVGQVPSPTPTPTPRTCPTTSPNWYARGQAFQFETDNPVRPAWNHADKNLDLRGYKLNNDGDLQRQLVSYGADDPTQPPQFATIFQPARVPRLLNFYRIGEWNWAPSPDPGWRGPSIPEPPVTALGLKTNIGETIHVPSSGYSIGGGMEVLLIYADARSVALRYTREDSSGSRGYSVFIENICTDPNLLALYNQLDDPNGPRYRYVPPANRPYSYDLPTLPAGKPLGTVIDDEIIVAISDTGRFWDPRSCHEWWQIRPGYTAGCPPVRWSPAQ